MELFLKLESLIHNITPRFHISPILKSSSFDRSIATDAFFGSFISRLLAQMLKAFKITILYVYFAYQKQALHLKIPIPPKVQGYSPCKYVY